MLRISFSLRVSYRKTLHVNQKEMAAQWSFEHTLLVAGCIFFLSNAAAQKVPF